MLYVLSCLLVCAAAVVAAGEGPVPRDVARKPVLVGEPWKIALMPDLGELNGPDPRKQHIVDHGFIRDAEGRWQLWACLRGVKVGRLLYRWEGESLEKGPWTQKGIAARADKRFGEQVKDDGTETMQAPYFRKAGDLWYCFYNSAGIRYMTSKDGVQYVRPTERNGSNLLGAPGGRDVMVLEHDGVFYSYATVSEVSKDGRKRGYVIGSSSKDLTMWTKGVVVSEGGKGGPGLVDAESPFVQLIDGFFYLFRSSSMTGKTYVYRSRDPLRFNINDDDGFVTELPVWAPEVIEDQGKWYLSDLGKFQALLLHRLDWREERDQEETAEGSHLGNIRSNLVIARCDKGIRDLHVQALQWFDAQVVSVGTARAKIKGFLSKALVHKPYEKDKNRTVYKFPLAPSPAERKLDDEPRGEYDHYYVVVNETTGLVEGKGFRRYEW